MGIRGTQSEYARSRKARGLQGGSPNAVFKAVQSGRITTLADGFIDFDVADIQWERNTRKRADLMPEQKQPESQAAPSARNDWSDHKARKESAEASLRELELAQRRGELIDRAGYERAALNMARVLRDALVTTLPSKLALELAAATDPWVVECTLRDAIRAELTAICDADNQDLAHAG